MTKTLLWLALKFVVITGPATWWWMYGGGREAYWQLYRKLAFPILAQLGVTTFPLGLVKDRLLSFLPFVALMLITPRLTLARRFGGMAIGLVGIFLGQVGLAWWAWWTHVRSGTPSAQAMSDFFPALLLMDALPFVLWALVANPVILEQLARIMPTVAAAGDTSEEASAPPPSPEPEQEPESEQEPEPEPESEDGERREGDRAAADDPDRDLG